MYGFEEPQTLKLDRVASLEVCPAIDGTGTKMPDANLVRWKAVFESFKDWHETGDSPGEIIDRQFAWMDPVQKDITATLFTTARSLLPRQEGETIDWDPPSHQVDLNGGLNDGLTHLEKIGERHRGFPGGGIARTRANPPTPPTMVSLSSQLLTNGF